ncbi:hypothetical protein Cni_G20923 [Canna indica]|uniref:Protein TIFY n=1 Tax=Canna indica TaxID=4628 RepID=A0AAQ3KS57_9LILI|nr:hypothetical protein Cni_G20923 [Canna indica]
MKKSCSDKSQFSVTCSLLSQYLKEKGRFGTINGLQISPITTTLDLQPKEKYKAPTTLSLLPGTVDATSEDNAPYCTNPNSGPKSMELFPPKKPAALDSTALVPPNRNKEVEKKQLTIFYGGKVVVFDDFPADKAESLMQMARKVSTAAAPTTPSAMNAADDSLPPNYKLQQPKANASADMPIARRNSLHRFLEKRKDRINTKAPYQVPGMPAAAAVAMVAAKPDQGSQSWLGLGRQASAQEHNSESSK